MALIWIWCFVLLVHINIINSASIVERSVRTGKKVVRHGDELFLVNDDIDNLNHNLHHHHGHHHHHHNHHNHHSQHKRPIKDDQGRRVIRIGDELIVLKDDDDKSNSDSHSGRGIHRRAAIKDESYRWTDKTVPYRFDRSFDAHDRSIVKSAMKEWSRHTCVIFRPARSSDANKVKFVNGDGCFSYVGMVETTQKISLDKDGCRYLSTALHEIGHALGMYHTQERPDRDRFIKIDMSNVDEENHYNFEKETWESAHHYGVKYDFESIMHYDGQAFASNDETSIKTKDPKWQDIIGEAERLSFGDIEMMNKMYHCVPETCKLKDSDCPGVSFVDQTCKCVCPGPHWENPVVPCSDSESNENDGDDDDVTGSGDDGWDDDLVDDAGYDDAGYDEGSDPFK